MRSRSRVRLRHGRVVPSIGCWRLADALGADEVRRALAEDRADDDVTTRLLGARADCPALGRVIAEGRFVVAGGPVVARVLPELEAVARVQSLIPEGEWAAPGATMTTVRAGARAQLAGERVALNFLQRLS